MTRWPFDPDAVRARLLSDSFGLDYQLSEVTKAACQELSIPRWGSAFSEIIEAHLVGLGHDPRVQEMLQLTVNQLASVDWPTKRAEASIAKPGEPVFVKSSALFNVADGNTTFGLARWLHTGQHQSDVFAEAFETGREYHDFAYGQKSKWRFDAVAHLVFLGCAAHCFADVVALFKRPQLSNYRTLEVEGARTSVELGHAIALHRTQGDVSVEQLNAICERTLRREAADGVELMRGDLAKLVYLVGMARGGDQRGLLDRMTEYVSYLAKAAKARTQATARKTGASKKQAPTPPPPPNRPLPPIVMTSRPSALPGDRSAMTGGLPPPAWKQVDTSDGVGWAVRIGSPGSSNAERDPRWPDVVELSERYGGHFCDPALTRLVRATVDGKGLSALAARPTTCPLEVAFPRAIGDWTDYAMVQINPPLTRGHWRQALAVGSLRNLRAISFRAIETKKQQIIRGSEPYVVGPTWFWDSPLARQLEALNVDADLHALVSWRARFAEQPRLQRVYLLVWCRQREFPSRRPVRLVIDRADDRLRLTVQTNVPFEDYVADDLATLFAGMTRSDVIAIDIDRLCGEITETEDKIARALGPNLPIGELRGNATLAEL
jgi:hypothetical protein